MLTPGAVLIATNNWHVKRTVLPYNGAVRNNSPTTIGDPLKLSDFADCGGPYDLTSAETDVTWNHRPTTLAERAVIEHLRDHMAAGASLMHMGVGNSEVYEVFKGQLDRFVGVSTGASEIARLKAMISGAAKHKAIVANKHDPRQYPLMRGPFEVIVDVNLKSFACCRKHFDALMDFYVQELAPGGAIATAYSGVNYGWPGTSQASYTPGASRGPEARVFRSLGQDGLSELCDRYGLTLQRQELSEVQYGKLDAEGNQTMHQGAETVLLLVRPL